MADEQARVGRQAGQHGHNHFTVVHQGINQECQVKLKTYGSA